MRLGNPHLKKCCDFKSQISLRFAYTTYVLVLLRLPLLSYLGQDVPLFPLIFVCSLFHHLELILYNGEDCSRDPGLREGRWAMNLQKSSEGTALGKGSPWPLMMKSFCQGWVRTDCWAIVSQQWNVHLQKGCWQVASCSKLTDQRRNGL